MMADPLFSPFYLKNFTLRNRLGVAPMTRMSSVKDSIPRQDVLDFLVRRARNGAALVYTEAMVTDYESAQGYPGQARLVTQRQIDVWRPVVEAIREAGAVAIMQMFHCGRLSWPEINPAGRTIAPSALIPRDNNSLTGQPYPVPGAMSPFDIEHVILGFVETARGAMAAGFDGVEIHGAHGYLISQFLSAYANQREDAYGGSPVNRFLFLHDIIQAVAPVIPPDRLLTVRLSDWGGGGQGQVLVRNQKGIPGNRRAFVPGAYRRLVRIHLRLWAKGLRHGPEHGPDHPGGHETSHHDLRQDLRPGYGGGRPPGRGYRAERQVHAAESQLGGRGAPGQGVALVQLLGCGRGLYRDAAALSCSQW